MRAWICLLTLGCATAAPPQKFAVQPTPALLERVRAADLAPALAELEAALRERAAKLPNLAVGVVTDEGLVWFRGFGARDLAAKDPVTADTVFRIGSITKVFTGLALLMLRDAGKLSFDQPAAELLPDFGQVMYPTRDSPRIAIRHLVTHSSGLPRIAQQVDYTREDHTPSEAELLSAIAGMPLEYAPGAKQEYSNLAMALAGLVVARASGISWREFVRSRILGPLGMNDTKFDRADVPAARLATGYVSAGADWRPAPFHWRLGAMESAGVLYSSVTDLARFVQFQLSAWPPRDAPDQGLLKRASLRESQQRMFGEFGVNWAVDKDLVWHNGGTEAYRSAIVMQPRRGIGVIALTGCTDDAVDNIARDALAKLAPGNTGKLGPALQAALDRFLAYYDQPDDAGAERTFSKGFRDAIPNLLQIAQQTRREFGACKVDHIVNADETQAVFQLACEKKNARLMLHISAAPPNLIDGAHIKPAE